MIWRHAWRNALFPVITLFGLWLPLLVTGSVFVEMVFAWPGLGSLAAEAAFEPGLPAGDGRLAAGRGAGGDGEPASPTWPTRYWIRGCATRDTVAGRAGARLARSARARGWPDPRRAGAPPPSSVRCFLPDPVAQPCVLECRNLAPSLAHPFGTDDLSRDVLSRVANGGRISLAVAVLAVGLSLSLGAMVGLVAGYWGGAVDAALMRLVDAALAIPRLFLLLLVLAVWRAGAGGGSSSS